MKLLAIILGELDTSEAPFIVGHMHIEQSNTSALARRVMATLISMRGVKF